MNPQDSTLQIVQSNMETGVLKNQDNRKGKVQKSICGLCYYHFTASDLKLITCIS